MIFPSIGAVNPALTAMLIDTPNWFSFIVALVAGVVGVVSLTEARSSTLIGVFISVTTIPAASDTGVSLAFGNRSEAWGSVLQLLLNVTVLTAVAIAGLPYSGSSGGGPPAGPQQRHPACRELEADPACPEISTRHRPGRVPARRMTETEFRALYERLRRQVPWGPDDRRGALNYVTQPKCSLPWPSPGWAAPCQSPPRWKTGRQLTTPTPPSMR